MISPWEGDEGLDGTGKLEFSNFVEMANCYFFLLWDGDETHKFPRGPVVLEKYPLITRIS